MQSANIFSLGMNQDLARDLMKPNYYFDADNMTLITENGQSTGSIQNIKGNVFAITLPNTSNVVEITIDSNSLLGSVQITIDLPDIGFNTVFPFIFTSDNELFYEDLADYINTTFNVNGIQAAYNADHLVIWSTLNSTNALINSTITVTGVVLSGTATFTINNAYVPAQLNLEWIGWGRIRDDFYLFSTNETGNASPTSSYGQIWKFEYDKLTFYNKLTLVYNNQINFTNFHPIPNPGGFVGNYETDTIEKIYWTDNYNRLRILNVVQPNVFALHPDDIDAYPNVALTIPILEAITDGGGQLNKGIWQCAYRLKNTTGSVTAFSTASNPVFLVGHDENEPMISYETDDPFVGNSGKTITFKIHGIDTSYDRIEVVALYRVTPGQTPRVVLLVEEPIAGNTEFFATFTGNQPSVDITLEEYQAESTIFDTIKTIQAKNNYLFAGNIKYSDFDVNFDATAIRYNNAAVPTSYDGVNNPDLINPNQNPGEQGDIMSNRFLFQSNGTTYGGTGVNVSYEFTTPRRDSTTPGEFDIILDNSPYAGAGLWTFPYFEIQPGLQITNIDLSTDFQQYNNPATYPDYHSPFIANAIRQYRRDEIYRFGIVFFSLKGEPSYVHWIGDIQMPHMHMPQAGSITVDRIPDGVTNENWFPLTVGAVPGVLWGNPMGIKFTVDVSSIQDQISGYSIVRVKRENDNKTVLGQGALYPAVDNGPGTGNYLVPDDINGNTHGNNGPSPIIASLNSPDFLFRGAPRFQAGDYLDYMGLLRNYANSGQVFGTTPLTFSSDKFFVRKYECNDTPAAPDQITNVGQFVNPTVTYQPPILGTAAVDLARAYDPQDAGGGGVVNMGPYFSGTPPVPGVFNGSERNTPGTSPIPTLGSKTLIIFADFTDGSAGGRANYSTNLMGTGDDVLNNGSTAGGMHIVNYKRNLTSQYGGGTAAAKSKNEYISTGHYQPVDDTHTGTTPGTYIYTGSVFGGDSYIALFDNMKQFPRTKLTPAANWSNAGVIDTGASLHIYPVETDININLRYSTGGRVPNKYPPQYTFNPPGYDSIDVSEQFALQPFVDMENDTKLFFPRPEPFIDRTKYDVRVFASQKKVNGELNDSWGNFKPDDYIDIDSLQGPLNNLIVHKDKLIAYQDQGICTLPVNERSLITDQTGAELTLGSGGVLPRYDYISKKIGSTHQFGFTQSPDAVFFFDMNSKSLYKQVDADPKSISLVKGMSSYFSKNLIGLIQTQDNPFRQLGITATYDFEEDEAIFTFRDKQRNPDPATGFFVIVISQPVNNIFTVQFPGPLPFLVDGGQIIYDYAVGADIISILCTVVSHNIVTREVVLQAEGVVPLGTIANDGTFNILEFAPFTIAYNDFIDAFTSFYDFHPCMYINDQLHYFSPSGTQDDLWIHRRGPYGSFYGTVFPSTVSFIINPDYPKTKRFSSYQMITEVYNNNQIEQIQETFDQIRLYNTNQNTDLQTLPIDPVTGSISQTGAISPRGPKQIARRVENQWNLSYLFDRVLYTTPNPDIFTDLSTPNEIQFAQRLRSKFLNCDLVYNNANNNNIILRNFISNFDLSPR